MRKPLSIALAIAIASARVAAAQTPESDEERTVPEASATPSPPPKALTYRGYVRSFYFTRQNASNNPGARFDDAPGASYNANGVNEAAWNSAISIGANYGFPGSQWSAGASYLYANPMDGACVAAANHAKGTECVTQVPPRTNSDDTLPGFTMSTFYETYVAYGGHGFAGTLGDQLFRSPWANPSDSRLKPAAFSGGDLAYSGVAHWTFEGADMLAFENRTSSDFTQQTLLTGYPAGARGLPSNIDIPGGQGIDTNGFAFGKAAYADPAAGLSAAGFFYGISDLANIWWFDGDYTFRRLHWAPFVSLQGGFETSAGLSYLGKIASQDLGAQIGADVSKNLRVALGYDEIPWRSDTIFLPKNVTCNGSYQIVTKGATLAYFLPLNAAQCSANRDGTTQIYYGGWASPYTDSYSTDPFFTTSVTQGMADRRAPGTSWKIGATFTSSDERWVFIATDAWYDYGNALAPQSTNVWVLDGRYHVSPVGRGPYRGLLLRYRYAARTQSNTQTLGGLPLFKYNRAQLEYDF